MWLATSVAAVVLQGAVFTDDFESGLDGWSLTRPEFVTVERADDRSRGMALRMVAGGPGVHAIIEGSEGWGGVRLEGLVMFPEDVHNYLAFIWGYPSASDGRTDFGSLYIKGNGSYIRVNPRYDGNPGRAYLEDYRTPLTGTDAVEIGRWQPFRLEVVDNVAHLYFGSMDAPKVTFDQYRGATGAIGFKPRVIGGDVWLDDVRVERIDRLTYGGGPLPAVTYDREGLLTDWSVLGPTVGLHPELRRSLRPLSESVVEDGRRIDWEPFETDDRGAVVTARVVEFRGERTRAYFATTFEIEEAGDYEVVFSTVDDLAIWVDGRFEGYLNRDRFAWHDFMTNEEHRGRRAPMRLEPGTHWLLVEVRGALYAGGAFFAGLRRVE